ncbi:MAG TPA: amidohydrolase family protein [Thermoanaerobaculia bacterium]|jgi:predicted TIM-barrel fold metal-dependent hydrolase|nr:amidohydrolase family protein [Thermoanaerobaculia bacterium]
MPKRIWRIAACLVVFVSSRHAARAEPAAAAFTGPKVDHHQHLLSPELAPLMETLERGESKPVELPPAIADLLRRRTAAWNDAAAVAPLYAEQALLSQYGDSSLLIDDLTVVGRKAVSEHVAGRFAKPYAITPVAYAESGAVAELAAVYTRVDGSERRNLGSTQLSFAKDPAGRWLIAGETMKFPAAQPYKVVDADALVAMLDEAEIGRAVVLSGAYLFESPYAPKMPDAAAKLRAENDWTAAQVARHPDRLVGFCAVNPLTDTALPEIERCARDLHLRGLKLHLRNSGVDLRKPEHVARLQQVFAAANRLALPLVVHLESDDPTAGKATAEAFLTQVLPHAPDVVVQVAHMAGSGPGWNDESLAVLAEAVERGDPRTRNLYFDVATVADLQKHDQLELLAKRIRQIGPKRILYGSDAAFGGHNTPDREWGNFRGMVPLTDAEHAIIRDNVAPYLR